LGVLANSGDVLSISIAPFFSASGGAHKWLKSGLTQRILDAAAMAVSSKVGRAAEDPRRFSRVQLTLKQRFVSPIRSVSKHMLACDL
jgi:hypothetical protein